MRLQCAFEVVACWPYSELNHVSFGKRLAETVWREKDRYHGFLWNKSQLHEQRIELRDEYKEMECSNVHIHWIIEAGVPDGRMEVVPFRGKGNLK